MKIKKISYSFLFTFVMLFGMVLPILGVAQIASNTRLVYETGEWFYEDEWSWTDGGWEFGPRASFTLEHANGTEINTDNEEYFELNTEYKFTAWIPDALFSGRANRSLGSVSLSGWYSSNDANMGGGDNFEDKNTLSADFNMEFYAVHPQTMWSYECPPEDDYCYEPSEEELQYWDEWSAWSSQSNYTGWMGDYLTEEELEDSNATIYAPVGAFDEWEDTQFFELDFDKSNYEYDEDQEAWYIEWWGLFNNNTYVGGYRFNLNIYTDHGEYISSWGFSAWETGGQDIEKFVGIGEYSEMNIYWGWGAEWGFDKLNLAGTSIESVGVEDLWVMRYNISENVDVGLAIWGFNLQDWYGNKTIQTGWHEEKVEHKGGWVFDEDAGTYMWDNETEYETYEQVYGEYEEYQWVESSTQHNYDIQVEGFVWDMDTQSNIWSTYTHWVNERLYIVYNATTEEFAVQVGYDYWTQDEYGMGGMEYVLWDPEPSEVTENIYSLVENSTTYIDGEGNTIIDFVGFFTENLKGTTQDEFWFDVRLLDSMGNERWMSEDGWSKQRISIDKPVAKSYIVDQNGDPYTKSDYMVEQDESFIIRSRLDGLQDFWNELDGVSVEMRFWEDKWTPESQEWAEIELISSYDFNLDEFVFKGYNMTQKWEYVNTTYWDWVEIEREDWHWEFNYETGLDEWVEGIYYIWEWAEVSGYHWAQFTYNQKDDVWFEGWLPWRSEETEIQDIGQLVEIHNVSRYKDETGQLYIDINITITSDAPDAIYNWEIRFQNKEYGHDYNMPWGEYDAFMWMEDDIFFYEVSGAKIFASKPKQLEYVALEIDGEENLYVLQSKPYVEIDDEKIPIKVARTQDWEGRIEERILYQFWDWETQEDLLFFKRENDSAKIPIQENFIAIIYEVQFDGLAEPIETFLTRTINRWSQSAGEEVHTLIDIYGDKISVPIGTEWNQTGGDSWFDPWSNEVWNFSNVELRSVLSVTQLDIEVENRWNRDGDVHYIIIEDEWVEVTEPWSSWWTAGRYVVTTSGERLDMYRPDDPAVTESMDWDEGNGYGAWEVVFYSGEWKWVSDNIVNGYIINYGGENIIVPYYYGSYAQMWEDVIKTKFVTVKDGVEYDIPFPGAVTNSMWEIENTVNGLYRWGSKQYGIVPVEKYVIINGVAHVLENLTEYGTYDDKYFTADIYYNETTTFTDVTLGFEIGVIVNNTVLFDVTQNGYNVEYGEMNYRNWIFNANDSIIVAADNYLFDNTWDLEQFNYTNYNPDGSYYLIDSIGTNYSVELAGILPVYKADIYEDQWWNNGQRVLVAENVSLLQDWPDWDGGWTRYPLANGTWLNFSSDMNVYAEIYGEEHIIADVSSHNYTQVYDGKEYTLFNYNWWEYRWEWEGVNYTKQDMVYNGSEGWERGLWQDARRAWIIDINGTDFELKDPENMWEWTPDGSNIVTIQGWDPIFSLTVEGQEFTLFSEDNFIYMKSTIIGQPYGLFMQDTNVMNSRDTWNFIVGTPTYQMWGLRLWTTTEDGAIDLDGDLGTTDDQYFVARNYTSTNSFTHYRTYMDVRIGFDPDTSIAANDMEITSMMGLNTMTWSWDWAEFFTWFDTDFNKLSAAEMDAVKDTVWDSEANVAKPGYWDIGRMGLNRTSEDIKAEAEANGWWWMLENEQTWTWLEFNIEQNYWADHYEAANSSNIMSSLITLRYEYAGLMLYNDTNGDTYMQLGGSDSEVTHFFVPAGVENVTFIEPSISEGTPIGDDNSTFSGDAKFDWGVNFEGISGTLYPYSELEMRSMWGWYDTYIDGEDYRTFENKPTKVNITSMTLAVHFQGNPEPEVNGSNYEAQLKIDQEIGDWDADIIGGRDVFENYSLALSYYVLQQAISSDMYEPEDQFDDDNPTGITSLDRLLAAEGTDPLANETGPPPDDGPPKDDNYTDGEGDGYSSVYTENGTLVDNEEQSFSESFSMVVEGAEEAFAVAELGSLYIWSKNTSMALNVSSFTSPIGTFQGAYQSGGGDDQSLASFKVQGELYFLTIGFSKWDGYSVFNDPTFNSLLGASEHLFSPTSPDGGDGGDDDDDDGGGVLPPEMTIGFVLGGGIILGAVFVFGIIKKKGRGKSFKVEPTF